MFMCNYSVVVKIKMTLKMAFLFEKNLVCNIHLTFITKKNIHLQYTSVVYYKWYQFLRGNDILIKYENVVSKKTNSLEK